jgi:formylglycine-generating enzyme
VGAYTSSPSYYGTFDQGGNVYEWNEMAVSSSQRGVRGGLWNGGSDILRSSFRDSSFATTEFMGIGFRVASIPEPGTAALIGLAAVALFNTRRRRALPTRSLFLLAGAP